MKALTIWQPWATLIMIGAKPFEFRRWPAPKAFRRQRIVIHAGQRPVRQAEVRALMLNIRRGGYAETGLTEEPAMKLLDRVRQGFVLPTACGLGTAVLGEPKQAAEIFGDMVGDSDRVDHQIWAWPLGEIEAFDEPVPARGAQGFWSW